MANKHENIFRLTGNKKNTKYHPIKCHFPLAGVTATRPLIHCWWEGERVPPRWKTIRQHVDTLEMQAPP